MAPVSPEVALAITSQKARYGRYIDTKQWDKWEEEVMHPRATCVFIDMNGKVVRSGKKVLAFSRAADMRSFFEPFFSDKQSMHMFGPGEFEQIAPDEVRAVFALEDKIILPPLGSFLQVRGGGFYTEIWKLTGGKWYLKGFKLERTYETMTFLVQIVVFFQKLFGL
jgi:hypothetical protein